MGVASTVIFFEKIRLDPPARRQVHPRRSEGGESSARAPRRRTPGRAASSGSRSEGRSTAENGGPGGWVILDEPELHIVGQVLVPDLQAGAARMPEMSHVAVFELAPDWIGEVLSPSTARVDSVTLLHQPAALAGRRDAHREATGLRHPGEHASAAARKVRLRLPSCQLPRNYLKSVRSRRLELPHPCGYQNLNLARLPVPPRPRRAG